MKFNPGQLAVTRGVNDLLTENEEFARHVHLSLKRHLAGGWGDVCDEDRVPMICLTEWRTIVLGLQEGGIAQNLGDNRMGQVGYYGTVS